MPEKNPPKSQLSKQTPAQASANTSGRTKEVPIQAAENQPEPQPAPAPPPHFELHIAAPNAPNEVKKPDSVRHSRIKTNLSLHRKNLKPLSNRIWSLLEWLATSAIIFLAFFFIMNYQSYSALFFSKLDQIRGQVQSNPYVQNLLNHGANGSQQPLALTANDAAAKRQVPAIDIEIAPPDDRIIIPRITQNVPIVKVSDAELINHNWDGLEKQIQNALRDGVVHYPGTAEPGDGGNVVVTGHSSYFAWDPGRFKDVFALLHQVNIGDKIIVYHNQKKYLYQVYDTKIITPDKVDVLTQNGDNRLTLITCTPVGTNLKRLVVFAHPLQQ